MSTHDAPTLLSTHQGLVQSTTVCAAGRRRGWSRTRSSRPYFWTMNLAPRRTLAAETTSSRIVQVAGLPSLTAEANVELGGRRAASSTRMRDELYRLSCRFRSDHSCISFSGSASNMPRGNACLDGMRWVRRPSSLSRRGGRHSSSSFACDHTLQINAICKECIECAWPKTLRSERGRQGQEGIN